MILINYNHAMMNLLKLIAAILPVISLTQYAHGREAEFNLTEVAQGVYVHQGRHVYIDHKDNDDIANIGFIVGEKCIAVIDTGGSMSIGATLRKKIKGKSSVPICYVINTHIHYDHVLGNPAFKSDRPEFIGHENLKEEINQNRPFFLSEFKANLGADANDDSIIGPDIVVSDSLELDLGNRIITLTAHPVSHSYTDLSVYDKKTGTLWLSDLLFMEAIPVLDGSLRGWLKTMGSLKTQQAHHVIPGHGKVSGTWPEAMSTQEKYLKNLLNETKAEINKGAFMEDVIDGVGEDEKSNWLLHEYYHKRNVTKAFTELEWE